MRHIIVIDDNIPALFVVFINIGQMLMQLGIQNVFTKQGRV